MLSLAISLTYDLGNTNFTQDIFSFFDKHFLLNNLDNWTVLVHHKKKIKKTQTDPYILSTDVTFLRNPELED